MSAARDRPRHVAVIGAGLSGLTAAQVLLDSGHAVTVVDKGRGVGGRLATRRIGTATLDHGAQFFTVRGDTFRRVVTQATEAGMVDVWCHGFGAEDGYPRFRGTNGMNAFAKWLAARVIDAGGSIITGERVRSIHADDTQWRLEFENHPTIHADDAIVTAPVPQALDLLAAGGVDLHAEVESELASISYKPTLALLVTLDGASSLETPGGIQRTEDDLFTFIADNHVKGISASPSLTLHVNGDVSARRWDDDSAAVISDLLAEAQPFIGSASVVEVQLKKWLYATPRVPHPEACLVLAEEPGRLVIAGDAFAGPKVEGAFNSGHAAGTRLASR